MLSTRNDVPFKLHSKKTESKLCSFYIEILKKFYKITCPMFETEISQSLSNIRSYKNRDLEEYKNVSFEKEPDRVAYIFAYGIIHSVVVYDRFSRMLKNNPFMLKSLKSLKKIKLCMLGGGPAVEVVAICKLLNDIVKERGSTELPPLQLQVTIIDLCSGWESDAKSIVKLAGKHLCDDSSVKIDISFIEADLTEDFSEEVKTSIKKSHFVTMVKFISDVDEASYAKLEVSQLILNILENMSPKACLFYLDTAGGGTFKKMDSMIDKLPHSSRIYGPCLHNTHMLNLDTVAKFSSSFSDIPSEQSVCCTCDISISCSAWLKIRHS